MKRQFFPLLTILVYVTLVFAQTDDLEYGNPGRGMIYQRFGYAIGFDQTYHQAAWVAYKLTAEEVCNRIVDRKQFEFRKDPQIPESATKNDYPDSKQFQRGHLAPAADMRWNEQAMKDCFYYSNTSPQRPAFNTGVWSDLETVVRNFAVDYGAVCVVTGPVLNGDLPTTFEGGILSVPEYFYKVILSHSDQETKAIGFVLRNEGSSLPVQHFAVTVDSVEQLTGLDFFNELPDSTENRIESTSNPTDWHFSTKSPCPKQSHPAKNKKNK